MKKIFLLCFVFILLLASCTHHSPFVNEYYFQAMGEEGEYVFTADGNKVREGELDDILDSSIKDNYIVKKTDRLSASLVPKIEEDEFSFALGGAVEGNFSSLTTNSALLFSSSFYKEKENGVSWYTDGNSSIYSPTNGLILFTNDSYPDLYKRTYSERKVLIDNETASLMADGAFSIYVFDPDTLVDIGFEIPQAVINEITETCLVFNKRDTDLVLSGFIRTSSVGTARALNTLFRNQIIQELRRNGEKIDTSSLSSIFTVNESTLNIDGYVLNGDIKNKAKVLINGSIGGMI